MNAMKSFTLAAAAALSSLVPAVAETLTWNGAAGAKWNTTDENWLDENSEPTAWKDGADAFFATEAATPVVGRGAISVRNISVASTVSVKPVITGEKGGTDTADAVVDGERAFTWDKNYTSKDWFMVWKNRKLKEITGIPSASIQHPDGLGVGRGYFWAYDAETDTATVQIQPDFFRSGQQAATDVEFRQNGADIEARILGSGYISVQYTSPNYHDRVALRDNTGPYGVRNFLATTIGSEINVALGGKLANVFGTTFGVALNDARTDDATHVFEGARDLGYTAWLSTSWKTIWTNRKLSNINGISYAYTDKTADGYVCHDCRGYFWTYDPETQTATTQIQPDTYNSTQMVGCDLEFKQEGNDIQVRVTGSGYASSRHRGTDDYHKYVTPNQTSPTSYMNVNRICAFAGAERIVVDYAGDLQSTANMTPKSAPVTIWKNVLVADLVAVEGRHSSAESDLGNVAYDFRNDGTTATVQLQKYSKEQTPTQSGLVTCCKIEFTQDGADVKLRVVATSHKWFDLSKGEVLQFPYPNFSLTDGSGTYALLTSTLKGYFRNPAKFAAPIEGIKKSIELVGGGLEFTGDNTFNFGWPLTVENANMPIGFSGGAHAVLQPVENAVSALEFAGESTLTLPAGATLVADTATAADGAAATVDADIDARPVRIGTSQCLEGAAKTAFRAVDGGILEQNSQGYLVAPTADLTWDGGEGGVWNETNENWKNAAGESVAGTPTMRANIGETSVVVEDAPVLREIRFTGATTPTVSGTGTLKFAEPAKITLLADGTMAAGVDDSAFREGDGPFGLTVANGNPPIEVVKTGRLTPQSDGNKSERVLWAKNAKLSEITGFTTATLHYNLDDGEMAKAYHFVKTETSVTVQFQRLRGSAILCVKAEFTEEDDGIYIQALYAKFRNGSTEADLGFDFDSHSSYKISGTALDGTEYKNGYNLSKIAAPMLKQPVYAFDGAFGVVGRVRTDRVDLTFGGAVAISSADTFAETPLALTDGAAVSVAAGVAAVTPKLTVTGAATLTFADGSSIEAEDIDLSAAETVTVVAAEGAKWMKVGRTLTKDELRKFAPGDGFRAKQDADGWLFAERVPGILLLVR